MYSLLPFAIGYFSNVATFLVDWEALERDHCNRKYRDSKVKYPLVHKVSSVYT